MKKLRTKQAVICFIGVAVCKLGFAGCYPFIPAYFAAAYLERGGRLLLGIGMFLGMAFMLPLTLMTKYVMTLLVTIVIIKLAEWVNKGCYTCIAAFGAGCSATLLSVFGEMLNVRDGMRTEMAVLEGVFIFAATMVLSRIIHSFLEFTFVNQPIPEIKSNEEEKLLTYAKSFQSLSDIFGRMNVEHTSFSAEEMGRMQNEITGKMCVSCDQCALCWEKDDDDKPFKVVSG